MAIKLDDDYRIESDLSSWNLVLERVGKVNPNTGKPSVTRDISYHVNLKHALETYCDACLKSCNSIPEVIEKIKELNTRIEALNLEGLK